MSPDVKISHPEKVLFPDAGVTKAELADYYRRVAPLMLPHLRGRPISMQRFPAGIGKRGFFHKDIPDYFPARFERAEMNSLSQGEARRDDPRRRRPERVRADRRTSLRRPGPSYRLDRNADRVE